MNRTFTAHKGKDYTMSETFIFTNTPYTITVEVSDYYGDDSPVARAHTALSLTKAALEKGRSHFYGLHGNVTVEGGNILGMLSPEYVIRGLQIGVALALQEARKRAEEEATSAIEASEVVLRAAQERRSIRSTRTYSSNERSDAGRAAGVVILATILGLGAAAALSSDD